MNETVIQTRNISKMYGKFAAVSDLSIQVERGDIYALVGQNGAGKTTLLKMICGLTPPSDGETGTFRADLRAAARHGTVAHGYHD